MWNIGEGLEEDLDYHAEVVIGRVELKEVLQSLDVLGVVSLNALKH